MSIQPQHDKPPVVSEQDDIPNTMKYNRRDRRLARRTQQEALPWYQRRAVKLSAVALALLTAGGAGMALGGNNSEASGDRTSTSADKDPGTKLLDPNVLSDTKPITDDMELRETVGTVFDEDTLRELAYDPDAVAISDQILSSTVSNSGEASGETGVLYKQFLMPIGDKFLEKSFLDNIYTNQVAAEKNIYGNTKVWNNPEGAAAIIGEFPYATQADIDQALSTGDQIPLVQKLIGNQINNEAGALLVSQLEAGDLSPKLRKTIGQYARIGLAPQPNDAMTDMMLDSTIEEYHNYVKKHGNAEGFDPKWYPTDGEEVVGAKVLRTEGYDLTDNYETGPEATVIYTWVKTEDYQGNASEYVYKVAVVPAPVKEAEAGFAVQGVVLESMQVFREDPEIATSSTE